MKISGINNLKYNIFEKISKNNNTAADNKAADVSAGAQKKATASNFQAYHPSFTAEKTKNKSKEQLPSSQIQFDTVNKKLDKSEQAVLKRLADAGILSDRSSDDRSSVLENLYKISTEPRISGLDDKLILKEVINALDNPCSIVQKFGDIPENVAREISAEIKQPFPESAYNVTSSTCVAASIEYNLAQKEPAEFARFAQELSSNSYSADKNIEMSDIAQGTAEGLWKLREFDTNYEMNGWDKVKVKIQPDENAIIRARIQTYYKDPDERSCVDVLLQSAFLNLGSQNTYNSLTDERTGKFNPDKSGLTDFEKNFTEQIVFETPKISVVYQYLDENGILQGFNCKPEETRQHILKSLDLGQNVIIGCTYLDGNNKAVGGHEITIIGYEQGNDGQNYFICNDTDDNIDAPVRISEEELLPLIHHAGISQEALNEDDIVVEPWREILDEFNQTLLKEKNTAYLAA